MRLLFFVSLFLLGSGPAHAQSGELAMVGEFYAEFVSAKAGEVWLGLYQVGDEYELRSSTLVVSKRDALMGVGRNEVQTDQPTEPLFLVRGLEELRPGKVETIIPKGEFLYPGQRTSFRSGGIYYSLGAAGEATDRYLYSIVIEKYKLILSSSQLKRSQTLLEFDIALDNAVPGVLWAGDLDRDGKVDLFMEQNRHYAYIDYGLFLSSAAKDEEMVGKVATWSASID